MNSLQEHGKVGTPYHHGTEVRTGTPSAGHLRRSPGYIHTKQHHSSQCNSHDLHIHRQVHLNNLVNNQLQHLQLQQCQQGRCKCSALHRLRHESNHHQEHPGNVCVVEVWGLQEYNLYPQAPHHQHATLVDIGKHLDQHRQRQGGTVHL